MFRSLGRDSAAATPAAPRRRSVHVDRPRRPTSGRVDRRRDRQRPVAQDHPRDLHRRPRPAHRRGLPAAVAGDRHPAAPRRGAGRRISSGLWPGVGPPVHRALHPAQCHHSRPAHPCPARSGPADPRHPTHPSAVAGRPGPHRARPRPARTRRHPPDGRAPVRGRVGALALAADRGLRVPRPALGGRPGQGGRRAHRDDRVAAQGRAVARAGRPRCAATAAGRADLAGSRSVAPPDRAAHRRPASQHRVPAAAPPHRHHWVSSIATGLQPHHWGRSGGTTGAGTRLRTSASSAERNATCWSPGSPASIEASTRRRIAPASCRWRRPRAASTS